MIKVENPDCQFTQEDINAQRLGGALFVGGATLTAGGALAGTVGRSASWHDRGDRGVCGRRLYE